MKTILILGALFSGLGVMIGAFGAHGLAKMLTETGRTDTFETAVKYQMYHALGLLILGVLMAQYPVATGLSLSGICFLVGILIFSGSLYVLCLTGVKWMGAITPIGGVFMIVGWLNLVWVIARNLR
ncbi:membrane protein [Rufibacter radiotolerans]|uniref:Membrane protein n=1 Tax=Rufibacter radiotolerans TaxID=1379910 RepID=A0A0H4VNU0_9BACT|nr:membrane protein [Rufibacter radiotolerans]